MKSVKTKAISLVLIVAVFFTMIPTVITMAAPSLEDEIVAHLGLEDSIVGILGYIDFKLEYENGTVTDIGNGELNFSDKINTTDPLFPVYDIDFIALKLNATGFDLMGSVPAVVNKVTKEYTLTLTGELPDTIVIFKSFDPADSNTTFRMAASKAGADVTRLDAGEYAMSGYKAEFFYKADKIVELLDNGSITFSEVPVPDKALDNKYTEHYFFGMKVVNGEVVYDFIQVNLNNDGDEFGFTITELYNSFILLSLPKAPDTTTTITTGTGTDTTVSTGTGTDTTVSTGTGTDTTETTVSTGTDTTETTVSTGTDTTETTVSTGTDTTETTVSTGTDTTETTVSTGTDTTVSNTGTTTSTPRITVASSTPKSTVATPPTTTAKPPVAIKYGIISNEGKEAGKPTIFCFIEILLHLVKMESLATDNPAAILSPEGEAAGEPTIFCGIEILLHIVGLPTYKEMG
ncbi:MAG: hypothetical protein FWF94_05335 [Oscillospiraceae bacterium]|nr:hypothetical protein [Oscillospiraceae bacterium]